MMLAIIHKMIFKLLRTYLFKGMGFLAVYTVMTVTKTMPYGFKYCYNTFIADLFKIFRAFVE